MDGRAHPPAPQAPATQAGPLAAWHGLAVRPGALGLGLAQLGQVLGLYMTLMALTVGAARVGHDRVVGLSVLFAVMALPEIFVGPFVAPLVERANKRTAMGVAQLGKALGLMVVGFVPGTLALAVGGLLVTGFHTVYLPAYRSLLAEVAEGEDQVRLTSLIHTGTTAMQMVGMGLGGAVAVFGQVSGALWLGAAVFALSALATRVIPRAMTGIGREAGSGVGEGYLHRLREGWDAVAHAPLALRILVVMACTAVASYVLNPVLVLIPSRVLGVPLWWYPVFEVAQSLCGVLLGGLLATRLPLPPRRLMGFGFLGLGLGVLGLAWSRSAPVDVGLYALVGLAQMAELPAAMALYRGQFPLAVRARATATYSMTVGVAQLLGAVLAGALAHALGVAGAIGVSGGMLLLATALGAAIHLFREEDAPKPVAAPASS